jgi:hypothetical protein
LARRLLERVESDEPLEAVIVDVVNALDGLTNGELAELLNAIGRRHGRDRNAGRPGAGLPPGQR